MTRTLLMTLSAAVMLSLALVSASPQSKEQQLVELVKENCRDARQLLEKSQLRNLERHQTAFNVLSADWATKVPVSVRDTIPADYQKAVTAESEAVVRLFRNAGDLQRVLKNCESKNTAAELATLRPEVTRLDKDLRSLRADLKSRAATRRDLKKHTDAMVDLLIKNNLSATSTYISIKATLDPELLDLFVTQHDSLLLPVQLAFDVLK